MSRWPQNGTTRLAQAALDLFAERGFDQTTVADIAARAGLTERTFFRHFADKREVLFSGSQQLQETMVTALRAAPPDAAPLEAVGAAVLAALAELQERREFAHLRNAVVSATPELQERELIKMATLSAALGTELRARGVGDPAAQLAADAGIAVFRVAFAAGMAGDERDFGTIAREGLETLTQLTATAGASSG